MESQRRNKDYSPTGGGWRRREWFPRREGFDQVEKYDLPTAPAKRTDKRGNGVRDTCQAEALPPDILLNEIEEAIKRNIDMAQLEQDRQGEQEERARLLKETDTILGSG